MISRRKTYVVDNTSERLLCKLKIGGISCELTQRAPLKDQLYNVREWKWMGLGALTDPASAILD